MNRMLKNILRDSDNKPYGVVVVLKDEYSKDVPKFKFGYSLTNTKHDTFNKKLGTDIAVGRANSDKYDCIEVIKTGESERVLTFTYPSQELLQQKIEESYQHLVQRAQRYFK